MPKVPTDKESTTHTVIDYDSILQEVHPQAIISRKRSLSQSSSSSASSSNSSSTDSSSSSDQFKHSRSRSTSCDRDVLLLQEPVDLLQDQKEEEAEVNLNQRTRAHQLNQNAENNRSISTLSSITERQIAIRTATQPHNGSREIDKRLIQSYALNVSPPHSNTSQVYGHPPTYLPLQIAEHFQHWPPAQAQLHSSRASQYPFHVYQPPPPSATPTFAPVIAPVINVRVNNAGRKQRGKQRLTDEELKRYEKEKVDKKRGAQKRLKKRIILERSKQ